MPSYTLAIFREKVYSHVENNTELYTLAEVDRAINEALQVLNLYTGYLQGSVTIGNTQINRFIYDVPSSVLIPEAVYLADRRLFPVSVPAMAMRQREWLRQTTANFGTVRHWIPIGITKFAIHPADATGGRSLKVEGVLEPTPLVNASDIANISDQLADAVQNLAAHVLMLKEGGKIFADASLQYQRFLHDMKSMGRWRTLRQPRYFIEQVSEKVPA